MSTQKKNTRPQLYAAVVLVLGVGTCCLVGWVALQGGFSGSSPVAPAQSTVHTAPASTEVANASNTADPTVISAPTGTPISTATPTLPPAGESRDNPVPAGANVDIGGDMSLTIVSAVRPADDIVRRANQFNKKPEAGQEYVQVEIQVVCNKGSSDKCSFSTYDIKAVGADGNIRDAESFLAGVEGEMESGEFFGGAKRTGTMFFIVGKEDKSAVLFYDPFLGSPIFLALP